MSGVSTRGGGCREEGKEEEGHHAGRGRLSGAPAKLSGGWGGLKEAGWGDKQSSLEHMESRSRKYN